MDYECWNFHLSLSFSIAHAVIEFCYFLLMNISAFLGGNPEASRPYHKKALTIPWCSFSAVTDYLARSYGGQTQT